MPRKHNIKEIHLRIDELVPFVLIGSCMGFVIKWSSDIGFGEYTIYKLNDEGKWYGNSECMDSNDDKEFISELMRIFVEQLIIK